MRKYSFKLNLEHLKAETPKLARRIGFTLLSVSSFIGGYEMYQGNKQIASIAFGIGVVGHILTSFFKVNQEGE